MVGRYHSIVVESHEGFHVSISQCTIEDDSSVQSRPSAVRKSLNWKNKIKSLSRKIMTMVATTANKLVAKPHNFRSAIPQNPEVLIVTSLPSRAFRIIVSRIKI